MKNSHIIFLLVFIAAITAVAWNVFEDKVRGYPPYRASTLGDSSPYNQYYDHKA